ncbi:hydrolase [Sneathiella sp. P13V-1]|uniref:carbon-nitrogen hydrolase family protein n=1 Tax=Sneathiella sp. P13V-1 TaxID=2697366 RepID=UPI00187B8689|nr:carbon-nitrogen hydrolase family protein [Sneathiella sp. P13V-1]MBE7636506.1 hydrolase [Sneathiella sp. P13V-1]
MKIAGAQFQPAAGDVQANLDKIWSFAEQAREHKARLLIVPELAVQGYGAADQMGQLANFGGHSAISILQQISRDTGVALIAGSSEKSGVKLHNSAVFVDGDREPVIYRKSNLYGPYEKGLFKDAEPSTVVFELDGLSIGMLICYDVEFPENVRRLAKAGVDLIAVPTATPEGSSGKFIAEKMLPTRSFENQVFIAYINFTGTDGRFTYQGGAGIHAPDGQTLAEAGKNEGIIFADIETENYAQSRAENTYLVDLKPGQ